MKGKNIIIDVDGVLNSFKNVCFYAHFVIVAAKELSKLRPSKKQIINSIDMFKKRGKSGLFLYVKEMSSCDEEYDTICKNIAKELNYSLIKKDRKLSSFIKAVSKDNRIIVKTDGLADIAKNVWQQIMGDEPKQSEILFSGIKDSNFMIKKDPNSWQYFAKKHNIDLSNSILIDDRSANIIAARKNGVEGRLVTAKKTILSHLMSIIKKQKYKRPSINLKQISKLIKQKQ